MSDYFALLAARLAGSPEAVRPRTPARFEPPPRDDPGAYSALTRPPLGQETGAPAVEALNEEISAAAPKRTAQRTPQRRRVGPRPPVSDDSDDSTADRLAEHVGSSGRPIMRAMPRHSAAQAPDRQSEPLGTSRREPARAAPPPFQRRPAPRYDERDATPESPHRAHVPPVSIRDTRSRDALVPNVRTSRQAQAPEARQAGAPPTIQITIGRIEVQAVTTTATPAQAPRRPSGPAVTLDAYIARRNEGES